MPPIDEVLAPVFRAGIAVPCFRILRSLTLGEHPGEATGRLRVRQAVRPSYEKRRSFNADSRATVIFAGSSTAARRDSICRNSKHNTSENVHRVLSILLPRASVRSSSHCSKPALQRLRRAVGVSLRSKGERDNVRGEASPVVLQDVPTLRLWSEMSRDLRCGVCDLGTLFFAIP